MRHNKRTTLLAAGFLCGTAVPYAMAQETGQSADVGQSCERLTQLIEQNEDRFRSEWIDQANGVARQGQTRECAQYVTQAEEAVRELDQRQTRDQQAGAQQQESGEADGSRIVVEQPQPRVTVQQDSPEITYNQPQPRVNVQQGQPEIIVRQSEPTVRVEMPQPRITIDQPEPEIVVRMPEPDVSVSMPEPQIDVSQTQPDVQVQQPQPEVNVREQEGAQVQVERSQPVVRQQGEDEQQAQINVERQQPQVRYEAAEPNVEFEMTGEPQVSFNRSGEPQVRFERSQQQASAEQEASRQGAGETAQQRADTATQESRQDQGQSQASAEQTRQSSEVDQGETASIRQEAVSDEAYQKLRGRGQDESGGDATRISVSELIGRDLVNRRGEELGTVERVISANDRTYVVLAHGGFLGLGQEEVALPLDRISSVRGDDELLMRGMTDDDIEALPSVDTDTGTELRANQEVEITQS